MRRAYAKKNPCVEVGDLRIELTSQRVWRGNEELNLTPREYALLEYLAMHTGQTISRTDTGTHCGLGLALVQRIITALGGSVTVEVQPGGIFTMRLVLPA